MSSVKPILHPQQVLDLIHSRFGTPAEALTPIDQGQIARTFSFRTAGRDYIIRFQNDNMLAHYKKEALVEQRYAASRFPVPHILHLGRFDALHYAISQRVPGRSLDLLSPEEYQQTLPSVVETLFAIHQTDVSAAPGCGLFDDQGIGLFPTWRDSLTPIIEEDEEWDFHGKWHILFETSFLERSVYEHIYHHMLRLLEYAPPHRYLIHGGYGFGNLLAYQGQVTGVVDWMDARYGDFVYDIAWLDFWPGNEGFLDYCYRYYSQQGFPLDHFSERLLCYQCYLSLDSLRFFAKVNNEDSYRWARDRILARLAS
jgi:hygromycin-B 4-O-kinase